MLQVYKVLTIMSEIHLRQWYPYPCIIIEHEEGSYMTNQVAGCGCFQKSAKGFLLMLGASYDKYSVFNSEWWYEQYGKINSIGLYDHLARLVNEETLRRFPDKGKFILDMYTHDFDSEEFKRLSKELQDREKEVENNVTLTVRQIYNVIHSDMLSNFKPINQWFKWVDIKDQILDVINEVHFGKRIYTINIEENDDNCEAWIHGKMTINDIDTLKREHKLCNPKDINLKNISLTNTTYPCIITWYNSD